MVERMWEVVRSGLLLGEGGSIVMRPDGGWPWWASWERAAYWERELVVC